MSKRRYVLVKNEGDGPKPCAFFASAAGCRNGAECKFLHPGIPTAGSSLSVQSPQADVAPLAPAEAPPIANEAHDVDTDVKVEGSTLKAKKKKKKKEKEGTIAAAAAAAAPPAVSLPSPVPPTSTPQAPPTQELPVPTAGEDPAASAVAEEIMSPTKAKQKKLREKALAKAAAAAAQAQAEVVRLAALAGVVAAPPTPSPVEAITTSTAPVAGTSDGAAAEVAPQTKKKKKKNKVKAAAEAAMSAGGVVSDVCANGVAMGNGVVHPAPAATPPSHVAALPPVSVVPVAVPEATVAVEAPAPAKKVKKRKNKSKAAKAAANAAAEAATATPAVPMSATPTAAAPALSAPTVAAASLMSNKKVCSFFNKKTGCKSGNLCPFLHQGVERGGVERGSGTRGHAIKPEQVAQTAIVVPAPAHASPIVAPAAPAPTSLTQPEAVPASPVAAAPVQSPPRALPVVAPKTTTPTAAMPATPQGSGEGSGEGSARSSRKRGRSKSVGSSQKDANSSGRDGVPRAGGGLLAGLPVSPFVQPAPKVQKGSGQDGGGGDRRSSKAEVDGTVGEKAVTAAAAPVIIPHPKADPWQELVDRTRAHPRFQSAYDFSTDATWITAPPCWDGCSGLPQVVAMDCEMCMSEDPLSKARNGKELVRLSVVQGEDGAPLLDTLVKPAHRVVSWRTDIHGVAPAHVKEVLFTHRHAQAAMARICCERTIIIGHAVHNDLEALKMKHDRVIDTSFLYQREGASPDSTPSLRDVVSATLGKDIQDGVHDSITDAQCTLDIARFALENGPQAPVPRLKKPPKRRDGDRRRAAKRRRSDGEEGEGRSKVKPSVDLAAFTVHRLPKGTTEKQLMRVLRKKTGIVPTKVDPIDSTAVFGKTQAYFESVAQAHAAFDGITTSSGTDSSGCPQKRIYTSTDGKSYIQVRQHVGDGDQTNGPGLNIFSESSSSSEEDSESDSSSSEL